LFCAAAERQSRENSVRKAVNDVREANVAVRRGMVDLQVSSYKIDIVAGGASIRRGRADFCKDLATDLHGSMRINNETEKIRN
jgi:hypothetical protein